MRRFLLSIITIFFLSCNNGEIIDGWDVRQFYPHVASSFVLTPGGHLRDAGPFLSEQAHFVSYYSINSVVDDAFIRFQIDFPELIQPHAAVNITEDYVMYVTGVGWAGGVDYDSNNIYVCLFSRGTSFVDPGYQFIKRPPDKNYAWWRFTTTPLMPAIEHELLHSVIGDPNHSSTYWNRVTGKCLSCNNVHWINDDFATKP